MLPALLLRYCLLLITPPRYADVFRLRARALMLMLLPMPHSASMRAAYGITRRQECQQNEYNECHRRFHAAAAAYAIATRLLPPRAFIRYALRCRFDLLSVRSVISLRVFRAAFAIIRRYLRCRAVADSAFAAATPC